MNELNKDLLTQYLCCTFPRCAKHVIQFGAAINGRSVDENDTPLHVAARHGLLAHVDLYLRHGAAVELQNDEGQTPLNAACSQPHEHAALERYAQVCQRLVENGADVSTGDTDRHTPLHMACKNANPGIVEVLLRNGAPVNDMDYGGEAPMHNILKIIAYKLEHEPERIVQELLNYGSIRVWPGALPKVSVGHQGLGKMFLNHINSPSLANHLVKVDLGSPIHRTVPKPLRQISTHVLTFTYQKFVGISLR